MPQAVVGRGAVSCPAPESLVPLALSADDPIIARHVAGCANCQLEVKRLQEAAGVLRGPMVVEQWAVSSECVDELDLADFVEGRLGPQARAPIVAHLLGCARCRSVVRATGRLLADPRVAAEVRSRRWGGWFLALGVAAAAAVVLLVWPRTEETGLPSGSRGTTPGSAVGPV